MDRVPDISKERSAQFSVIPMEDIQLSVVAASRNDDHGGNLLYRMQCFVTGFIEQCRRHALCAELILVDWNPPSEKQPLSKALTFPEEKGLGSVRIITVPKELHDAMEHSRDLPLFQMIAKNVGIRRARGKYVLATNIDIIFSDEIMVYLRDKLQPGRLYRATRIDVPKVLPDVSRLDELQAFCKENILRINEKHGTKMNMSGSWEYVCPVIAKHQKVCSKHNQRFLTFWLKKLWLHLFYEKNLKFSYMSRLIKRVRVRLRYRLHTNACGDFTLLAKSDWEKLKGYPELKGYSWHLDSYFLYQSAIEGIQHVELSQEEVIYHIEHGKGSGFTPEDSNALFDRLKAKQIPFLSCEDLIASVLEMSRKKKKNLPIAFNPDTWGLQEFDLKETTI